MTRKRAYDYGTCHVCGGPMLEKEVVQDLWIRGKLIVIDGVPAGVCGQCGQRVVRADVGRGVAALVSGAAPARPTRSLRVPVIAYKKKVA